MATIQLIFNCDDERNERDELTLVLQATNAQVAVWEFKQWLRNQYKYEFEDTDSVEPQALLEKIREKLHETFADNEALAFYND